jgi:hypothetical protein
MSYAATAADPTLNASDQMTKEMELATNKCNNVGRVVTLITTAQQITTGMKSAET